MYRGGMRTGAYLLTVVTAFTVGCGNDEAFLTDGARVDAAVDGPAVDAPPSACDGANDYTKITYATRYFVLD